MFYRIINLSTELVDSIELPIIAGSHHVTQQCSGYYTAHSDITIGRYGKFHPTLAVIYKDNSGSFLVGAQTEFILDIIGEGAELDSHVHTNPSKWHCYKGSYVDPITSITKKRIFRNVSSLNHGLLIAMNKVDTMAIENAPVFNLQATVPCFCCGFNPRQIELNTRVYGELE